MGGLNLNIGIYIATLRLQLWFRDFDNDTLSFLLIISFLVFLIRLLALFDFPILPFGIAVHTGVTSHLCNCFKRDLILSL